ncbi:MAG: hypothetical protein RL358_521 [Pseudomonadota bacterium]|jgi:type I restriction enzyme S subunit
MSWPLRPISDLCEFAIDCVNKTAPVVNYDTPYKMIRTTNVKGGFIDVKNVRRVTKDTYEKWTRRSRPRFGDVILTREAPLGEVGRCTFDDDEHIFLGQRLFHYRPNPELLDWNFLAYVLQSPSVQARFHGMGFGATVSHVKVGDAETLLIPCPSINLQKQIGSALAAYDDLIDTNRRRIALLEESARLLYREWFVKLRFPGHESVKVVDGVPEGWELKPIADFASLLSRGITPKYDDLAKGLIINQKCIREGRLNLAPARRQSKEVKQDKLVQLGDILINSTGAGTLGRVAQLRCEITDCTVDTHVTIVRPKSEKTMGFLGVALLELAPVFESMGRGATNQLELGRTDIGNLKLLAPSEDIQADFHRIVWTNFEQVNILADKCDLLAEARDALLPKLMSGQLAA